MKKQKLIINGKIVPFKASIISSIWGLSRHSEFLEICIIEEKFDFASEEIEITLSPQVQLPESIEKMIAAIVETSGRQKDNLQVCVAKDINGKKKLYICFGKVDVDFFPYGTDNETLAIVIDNNFEFELSDLALSKLDHDNHYYNLHRTDLKLVEVVFKLGFDASGGLAHLKIVHIPKKYENDWKIIPLTDMNDPAGERVVYSKSPSPPEDWYVKQA